MTKRKQKQLLGQRLFVMDAWLDVLNERKDWDAFDEFKQFRNEQFEDFPKLNPTDFPYVRATQSQR